MTKPYPIDPDSELISESYAVVYTPRHHRRDRFPENCVVVFADEKEARAQAKPEEHYYAARVVGPSRSSEGCMLFYLLEWLV